MIRRQLYKGIETPPTHAWMVCVGIKTSSGWNWVNCFGPTQEVADENAQVIVDEWMEKIEAAAARREARKKKDKADE